MNPNLLDEFTKHLVNKKYLSGATAPASFSSNEANEEPSLRKLWEATDLSANSFADEVAHFYGMTRLSLPDLVAAKALTDRFSPRFLRETTVFPFVAHDGAFRLAVADPGDRAAVRAAEIVLGGEEYVGQTYAAWLDVAQSNVNRIDKSTAMTAARWRVALAAATQVGFTELGDIGQAHFEIRLERHAA